MKTTYCVMWLARLVVIAIGLVLISACKQVFSGDVVRYADKSSFMANSATVKRVDRTFYGALSMGDWDYQGANVRFGSINAYIQIPTALDMDEEVQERYIQQVLCPSNNNVDLWYSLKNIDLQVHLYTDNKNKSISAICANPLDNRA